MDSEGDGIYTIWLSYEGGEEAAISLDMRAFRGAMARLAEISRPTETGSEDG